MRSVLSRHSNGRLRHILIGYAPVSKADGSQSLDLQRDVLRTAGVDAGHVYHDFASGVRDDTRTQQLGIRACDYCCAESPTNAASASDPVWKASGQPPWASITSSISAMIRMVSFRATTIF